MTIALRPFDDLAALAVFNRLDIHDHMEAEAVRGAGTTSLALFADWRMVQGHGPLSVIAVTGPAARPFAVLHLGHTGQAGVAQGALLACDHARHRMALARLCVTIRARMPAFCTEQGIARIEARCWAGHPTAARLLETMGFIHECDMPGFGRAGRETFRQYAYISPVCHTPNPPTE